MKNTFKTAMIATLIATLIIVSTAFTIPASAEEVHSVVIGSEYEEAEELWRIDCIAEDGNIWAFLADGAWEIGDVVILLMDDEEVHDVMWIGYLELDELVAYLLNVR